MRKLLLILVFGMLLSINVFANESNLPEVTAKGACLMDYETGRVLYEKNMNEPLPMASTTKIMTCILALESGKLEEITEASERAVSAPKVRLCLSKGEKHRLYDLLYPLMLMSSNDCAVVIAEHIGGSVEGFAKMMNEKAKEIGCKNTVFVTPNGLDEENHHSTAYDMALITRYALQNEEFRKIIGTKSITIPLKNYDEKSYNIVSRNRLLNEFDGALGVKTGFTGKAGQCFVGAAERNGLTLISVNLASGWGSIGKERKWTDSKNMLKYGFDNYEKVGICSKGEYICDINVTFSDIKNVKCVLKEDGYAVLKKDETEKIKNRIYIDNTVEAPVKKGEKAGEIVFFTENGELLFKTDILFFESANRYVFKEKIRDIIGLWCKNFVFDM